MRIYVINGPSLNMLGVREPDIYGKTTYRELVSLIEEHCSARGIEGMCDRRFCSVDR